MKAALNSSDSMDFLKNNFSWLTEVTMKEFVQPKDVVYVCLPALIGLPHVTSCVFIALVFL